MAIIVNKDRLATQRSRPDKSYTINSRIINLMPCRSIKFMAIFKTSNLWWSCYHQIFNLLAYAVFKYAPGFKG